MECYRTQYYPHHTPKQMSLIQPFPSPIVNHQFSLHFPSYGSIQYTGDNPLDAYECPQYHTHLTHVHPDSRQSFFASTHLSTHHDDVRQDSVYTSGSCDNQGTPYRDMRDPTQLELPVPSDSRQIRPRP